MAETMGNLHSFFVAGYVCERTKYRWALFVILSRHSHKIKIPWIIKSSVQLQTSYIILHYIKMHNIHLTQQWFFCCYSTEKGDNNFEPSQLTIYVLWGHFLGPHLFIFSSFEFYSYIHILYKYFLHTVYVDETTLIVGSYKGVLFGLTSWFQYNINLYITNKH